MKDLGKSQKDYAVYLPAISSFYVKQLKKVTVDDDPAKPARVPAGFELGNEGLDFLKDNNSYYHYPWGLYSAGHAQLDLSKTDSDDAMVQKRDRSKTVILGDSGGFQVATGVIKMDWENATNPNDPAREKLCETILRWLEHSTDFSMILDVPSVAAVPPLNQRTGLKDFQTCIDITCLNVDYFLKNRVPGATKFMNILSGNDEEGSKQWYESVKKFSDPAYVSQTYGDANRTLEGFAFAGSVKSNMYLALTRILDLRRDGLLEGKEWIHFLGTGKLDWACYLTSIQRQLRKYDSENITLSFDAASPFVNTAYGQCYSHNYFLPKKFQYGMDRAFDSQQLKGSDLPMPFNGPIMSRLTAGDICVYEAGDRDLNGNPKLSKGDLIVDKHGEPKLDADGKKQYARNDSTSWDTLSYMYMMAHSVYNHIDAVQEANRLRDIEKYRMKNISYKNWVRDKKGRNTNEFSPYVPYSVVYFDSFAEDLLDPANPDPYQMLDDWRAFLEEISFGVDVESDTFDSFFAEEEVINVEAEIAEHRNFEDLIEEA